MWEPTGKKATDRTTGAKLVEQRMTVTGSLRWEVRVNDVLLGYVHDYEGTVDKKAPGSRIVYSRTYKRMWAMQRARVAGGKHERTYHRYTTRASAVRALIGY